MAMPDSTRPWRDLTAARPREEFAGRRDLLLRLRLWARRADGRGPDALGLTGPAGCGRSEILRQLTLDLAARETPIPFYFLQAEAPGGSTPGALAITSPVGWLSLLRALIRQTLFRQGRLEADERVWLRRDPSHLSGICHGAELHSLAELTLTAAPDDAELGWEAVLAALAADLSAPPLLIVDGLAPLPWPEARAALMPLVRAALRAGADLLLEGPESPEDWPAADAFQWLAVPPLNEEESLALISAAAVRANWALPLPACRPVVRRLGGRAAWLHAWAASVEPGAEEDDPHRRAHLAYVDLACGSHWANRLMQQFQHVVRLNLREPALRLIQRAVQLDRPLSADEVLAFLPCSPAEAERILEGIGRLGLLTRRGARWGAPAIPLLADWAHLYLTAGADTDALPAERLRMLSALLRTEVPAPEAPPAAARFPDARALLAEFRGQSVPEMLFQFADFSEAAGRMTLAEARELAASAAAAMPLPEILGVAPWQPAGWSERHRRQAPPVYYAHGYRGGKYQRSHEEVWLLFDLRAVSVLTSVEIDRALGAARAFERRMGPGRYRLWLLVGKMASPEAMERLRQEQILASGPTQIELLVDLLKRARRGDGDPSAAAATPADLPPDETADPAGESASAPAPPGRPGGVIVLGHSRSRPENEISQLSLPARSESEVIAAMMAEKVALQAGLDPAAAGQVKTAVLEGVLNAIEHSPSPEKMVELQFAVDPLALEVVIQNEGTEFDPLAIPEPNARRKLETENKRGWGIRLMQRFMDEVGYEPFPGGTRLRLVKRRPAPRGRRAESTNA
ncbi:MAG TPA: ATP-binding protein [Candidatus Sumerlaeota bacterium]|nr:MAG: Anti-sigma F factor [candidate division BRC1 bacterium ADurb.BinA292]HOE96305.1 ATP-binding protein [Candidatus Sumerlaeota bacterium]HOR27425.1 ATP-binding protein [Candidatus Sumerlaeota bacterium]HPK01832.1 ATP-binding protein [Candidatus Sumerlaeota bacterium]